uniref:Uncharacterized protein n=1 Tax=Timema genevievae TaxID=629358 RepID=A0A7R9K4R9_TIMGE|nr:unnamed protein product [Timema genevievae]
MSTTEDGEIEVRISIYMNCSCVSDINILTSTAKGGACSNSACTAYWSIVQAFGVISAALLGSCIVGNVILSFRCVLPQDKSTVIGMELTFVGLIAYIPGKIIYHFVAGHLLIAAILDSFVCYFARNIPLYIEDGVHEMVDDSENEVVNPSETSKKLKNRRATPVVRRKKKENEPTQTLDDNDSSSSENNTESRSVHKFAWRENRKPFWNYTLSTPNRDSNLKLPIIGSLVYYESCVSDHAATEVAVARYAMQTNNLATAQHYDVNEVNVCRWRKDFPKLQNCTTTSQAFRGPTKERHKESEEKVTLFKHAWKTKHSFRETGSMSDKKRSGRPSSESDENMNEGKDSTQARQFVNIELPPTCRAEDDQPIPHYEDDEDEVFLSFDNTDEAYAPSPDGSAITGDISSTP